MKRPVPCLLVVQKGDHSLGHYDPESGQELARVLVAPFPHVFALSPDHRLTYPCDFGLALAEDGGPGGNTVSVVALHRQSRMGASRLAGREGANIGDIYAETLETLAPIATRPCPVRICQDGCSRLLVAL